MKPLPTPPNWDDGLPALAKFGFLLFLGGAIYSAAQAVVALQLNSSRLHAAINDRGTTLRTRPLIVWCWAIALIGAAFGSGLYVVFITHGVAELPFAAPGRGLVNQFLMGSLLVLSLIGLAALLKRREPGYLRIGRDGVENYWKHPENRAELTDGRALDRLRNEQFEPE